MTDRSTIADPKAWGLWIVIAAMGGGGATGVSKFLDGELSEDQLQAIVEKSRPDPFTGADARMMRKEIGDAAELANSRTIRVVFSHICTELRLLRAGMPPEDSRKRILSLERAMRSLDATYIPPSTEFGKLGPPCASAYGAP